MRTPLAALLPWLVLAGPALAVDVTTCGQSVVGTGSLVADLDCSDHAGDAIQLRGRLLLNGFRVTGSPAYDVVRCGTGRCVLTGPGAITGGADGVRADGNVTLKGAGIANQTDSITIAYNAGDGVRTDKSAKVSGATIIENGGDGIRANAGVKASEAIVGANAGDGIRADLNVTLRSVTIAGNDRHGVEAGGTAKGGDAGVVNNGLDGIRAAAIKLTSYQVTGNGTSPACGVLESCADLASETSPSLKVGPAGSIATCGTSLNTDTGQSWGVCSND